MKRIGIIGAGQLGQMLGQAGRLLNLECVFLDPAEYPPAARVGKVIRKSFDDLAALQELAATTDVVTYEFENVPVAAIESIAGETPVYPPPDALRFAQDRLSEKKLFESLDIPVANYRAIESAEDLRDAAGEIGLPIVLKTRRLGYDGKGQIIVRNIADTGEAVAALGGADLIAEQMIAFDREVSAIGVRNIRGEVAVYPLIENQHRDGILDCSRAPIESGDLSATAGQYLDKMLSRLDYVGVLTIEFFVSDGRLLANEFAPRVHNSGHWTIEGAHTSQFANHLRAILDMPLGDVSPIRYSAMLNLIGSMPQAGIATDPAIAWLHDYGKAPRPGRKLGHITIVADNPADREREIARIREILIA